MWLTIKNSESVSYGTIQRGSKLKERISQENTKKSLEIQKTKT